MVKLGGPCQAPGKTEGTICGVTEIGDNSDWRRGGKHKPEHAGKWCCPKNKCRIALGVIPDPKAPKAEVAPAPAPAASGPLGGLLDAVSTALAGPPAPATAPAAASASAASASSAPPAPIATAGKRSGRGAAAASAAAAAAPPAQPAQPDPPDSVPPERTPLERQRDVLDALQLPEGWLSGVAQLQSGPRVYFWPSSLAEQRWTSWRSPLDAPALCTAVKLEGHQEITKDDGSIADEWRVYGEFRHGEEKFEDVSEAEFVSTAWVSDDQVADSYLCQLYVAHQQGNYNPETDREFLQYVRQYFDTLVENSKVVSRTAMREWLEQSAMETEMERQRQARVAQMEQDDARYDAIQAVAAAPAERLAAIMAAAAATPPAPAAPPAPAVRPPAAAAAAPAASPRATRATSSSPASPAATMAPAAPTPASAARRSPRPADPAAAPGSNAARKRPKTS